MKKLFLLLLIGCSVSAQAQFNDSLPWFKLDLVILQLEDQIGDITDGQIKEMQSSVSPILRQAKGRKLTQEQRLRIRQSARKAITAVLTPSQLGRLKATRKGNRDALDRALSGEKGLRKRNQ